MQYSLSTSILAASLMAVGLSACSQPLGLEVEDRIIPVIDMHLHTGNWEDIPKIQQDTIRGFLPGPLAQFPETAANIITSARGIRDNMNNANINWGVLLAVYSPHSTGVATNELVQERVAKYPSRFMGIASLDTEHWDEDE
ncbi:MAG: hypothetical protein VX834_05630, partial [Myxococcota bacterium]|nr:hypothetical protein [Myxococcota bacterium]